MRGFGEKPPLFVLTGGDPMRRPDLAELVRYAAGIGLTVALTPSGTAAATPAKLAALKEAGLSRLAVSLDGPTPELHDAFRGVRGSYRWTMRPMRRRCTPSGLIMLKVRSIGGALYQTAPGEARRRGEVPPMEKAVFSASP